MISRRLALLPLLLCLGAAGRGAQFSVTMLPNASIRYRGEGKVLPESYVNRFGGETSPLYRLEYRQDRSEKGYWGLSLIHTGVFGGGAYAHERVPEAGGTYQTNLLNVGFTNFHITRRLPLGRFPSVEALAEITVARQIFKRKKFLVQGVDGGEMDDVSELSAEGFGVGLAGRHGRRAYGRWELCANHMVQIFDAKTDASAGRLFRAEAAAGVPLGGGFALELGAFQQYWFILGQGKRRLALAGTDGAVISWNRQETRASGLFFSLRKTFVSSSPE